MSSRKLFAFCTAASAKSVPPKYSTDRAGTSRSDSAALPIRSGRMRTGFLVPRRAICVRAPLTFPLPFAEIQAASLEKNATRVVKTTLNVHRAQVFNNDGMRNIVPKMDEFAQNATAWVDE